MRVSEQPAQLAPGGPWRVQFLGTFRATRNGKTAAFRTKKTSSLFAYLAYYTGKRISKDLLVDSLWPEADAEKGRHSLRVALSSLRASFEAEDWDPAEFIWSDRDTIELREGGFSTDVREFWERLATKTARQASLEAAVGIYQGQFLPGFSDPWILPQALELEESYAQAVCELIDLKAEDLPSSVAIGRRALSQCPSREDLHLALMRAYARAGQSAQAVKQFEELEKMLDDTWGEMPSDEAHAILDSLPRRSSPLINPKESKSVSRDSVTQKTFFVGRSKEVADIQEIVSQVRGRLTTLVGLGGSGKTRLGMGVQDSLYDSFNGRAWMVPMVGLEEEAELLEALLAALAPAPETGIDALAYAAAVIGNDPALLVMDNAEQFVPAVRTVVQALLGQCKRLHILVTSRVPLDLEGERLYPVLPLQLPTDYRDLQALRDSPSVQLLVDAAQAVRPGFAVTPANAQSILLLTQKLEGIPLAIELAAAKLGSLTPAQVIASIGRRSDLGTTSPGIREQHRSLRTVVEWSLGLLTEEERRGFAILGVCRGGFNVDLGRLLLGADADDEVHRLCRCSLVGWHEVSDQVRFEMLETVREMAEQLLGESPEVEQAAIEGHFRFALELTTSAERDVDFSSWAAKITTDTGNVLAAIESATSRRVPVNKAWELVLPLQDYVDRMGRPQIWLGPFKGLLEATQADLDATAAARAHMLLADTLYGLRNIRPCFEQYVLAAKAADDSGDRLLRITTRTESISAAITLGAFDYAQKALEEAIQLLPESGEDPRSAAMCHLNLAWVIFDKGNEAAAEPAFIEAVHHAERSGDKAAIAAALTGLGCAVGHTRYEDSLLIFERARSLWTETEMPSRLAHWYYNRALIDYRHGHIDSALEHLYRSYATYVENGVALGQSALTIGGNIFAAAGRFEGAAHCWGRADLARERQGMLMIPFMKRDYEREAPKVTAKLTGVQIEEARQRSKGLSDQGFMELIF